MQAMTISAEEAFRRLTMGDTAVLAAARARTPDRPARGSLDHRMEALLQVGALVAVGAPASSYRATVQTALRAGARMEDLLGVLVAVSEVVGTARVVAAAPALALAAGYDVEAALEQPIAHAGH